MNRDELQQLIAATQAEVDAAMLLLQGAQSRLKGLLALSPEDSTPTAPETLVEPPEPSKGAALIEQWQVSQVETFGGPD